MPLPGSPALKRVASLELPLSPGGPPGGAAGASGGGRALPLRDQPAYSGGNSFGAFSCVGVRLTPVAQAIGPGGRGPGAAGGDPVADADLAGLRSLSPGPQRAALVAASLRRLGRLGVECDTGRPSSPSPGGSSRCANDPLPQLGVRTRLELRIDGEADGSSRGWHGLADGSVGSQRPLPMGQALRGEGTPPSDGLAQAWSGLLHHSAPAAVLALALVDGPSHLLLGPEGALSVVRGAAVEEVARRLSLHHPEAMLHGVLVVHDDGSHQAGEDTPAAIHLNGGLFDSLGSGLAVAEVGSLGGVLRSLGGSMVQAVRSWLLHANPGSANLKTPYDLLQGLGATSEEERARKQSVTDGRLRKKMGDFSLMVGDPGDAFLHYCAAIDIARANADNLWLAAALEGVTAAEAYAAHAAQDERSGEHAPKVADIMQSWEDAVEACTAAARIYEQIGLVCFHISALIRLAKHGVSLLERLRLAVSDPKNVSRLERDVKTIVSLSLQACSQLSLPTMAVDHGLILADISDIWLCLGKKRRFAFFAKQAAEALPASQEWAEVAMQLMISAAEVYKAIAIPRDSRRFFNYAVPVADTASKPWPSLQKAIQDSLLLAAVKVGDSELTSAAAFHCLTLKILTQPPIRSDADVKEWEGLFNLLHSGGYGTAGDNSTATAIAMDQQPTWPVARAFKLLLPAEGLRVRRRQCDRTSQPSVFIYDAHAEKSKPTEAVPIFPRGESLTVAVLIQNPFPTTLNLTLELKASRDRHVGWVSQRRTVEMPARIPGARSPEKVVHLQGYSNRGLGLLHFLGVLVTTHGVRFFQPWKGDSRLNSIQICPPMAHLSGAFERDGFELYEGETLETHLQVCNQSNVEPRLVGVEVERGVVKAAPGLQVAVEDLMSQRPPVTGFERADFKITAPKMDSGAARETFFQSRAMCRVEYASQLDPEFTRTFDVPFRLTVHPCLQMESCVVEKSSLSICVTNHLQEAALLKIHWTVEGALSSRREPLDDLDKIGKGCTNTVRVPLPRGIKKKFAEALEAAWHSEPAGGGESLPFSLQNRLSAKLKESMTISWTLGGSNEPQTSYFGGRSLKEVLFSDIVFRDVSTTCSPLRLSLTCERAAAVPTVAGCEEFKATLCADSLFEGVTVSAWLRIRTSEGARASGVTGLCLQVPPGESALHAFCVSTTSPGTRHYVQVYCDVCEGIRETVQCALPVGNGFAGRIPAEVII